MDLVVTTATTGSVLLLPLAAYGALRALCPWRHAVHRSFCHRCGCFHADMAVVGARVGAVVVPKTRKAPATKSEWEVYAI